MSTETAVAGVRPPSVKSAARAVQLLEVLAEREGVPASLAQLAEELHAPRSSVHALLRTLIASGWVRTDVKGTVYLLGLRALLVGTSFLLADPYVRLVRPILADLRDELNETVHLARLDRDEVVYLVTWEAGPTTRWVPRVGRWRPAHSTGLGKAILAARGDVPQGSLEAKTPKTLTRSDEFAADLQLTRERGYSVEVEEDILDSCGIGVALTYTSPVVDAISCSVPTSRFTDERRNEIVAALLRVQRLIEESAPLQGTF